MFRGATVQAPKEVGFWGGVYTPPSQLGGLESDKFPIEVRDRALATRRFGDIYRAYADSVF